MTLSVYCAMHFDITNDTYTVSTILTKIQTLLAALATIYEISQGARDFVQNLLFRRKFKSCATRKNTFGKKPNKCDIRVRNVCKTSNVTFGT